MVDIMNIVRRGSSEIIQEEDLEKRLLSKKILRIKAGFDPTAPDLHLGHTVLINKLRHFQDLGHTVIFLVGDFTASIGDPSGKNETRPSLSREQIMENAKTYQDQVFKILDKEKTEIRFNSEWSSILTAGDVIKLASCATVARMLERNDFENRYKNGIPIAIHEFLYPLMQGYDSVALKADVELGGNDQKFNLLMGRTLQSHWNQTPQVVLTMPLLEGLDGVKKMSKSLGNYIGITEEANSMFGKIMSISDTLMWRYYEMLSLRSLEDIEHLKKEDIEGRKHPKIIKEELAFEIVERFHSTDSAHTARVEFNSIFSGGNIPEEVKEYICSYGEESIPLHFLLKNSMVSSKGEARRLIEQGAFSINSVRCEDAMKALEIGEYCIRLGKRRFLKVIVQ
ncbi:MAG: tyrosine--tRNA ligase [Desulfovibrionaceae bacterium]